MSGKRLSQEQRARVLALLKAGRGDRAIARLVGCDAGTVYYWRDSLGLVKARQPRGPQRICIRAGCDAPAVADRQLCEAHDALISPVLPDSGFIRPPSKAQLMGCR